MILGDTIALHEEKICNICIYQPNTNALIGITGDTIALLGKNNLYSLFISTKNCYIYWDNIRRHHCIIKEKIIYIICIYLPETNRLGWEYFPMRITGITLCTGKSSLLPWDFLSITVH